MNIAEAFQNAVASLTGVSGKLEALANQLTEALSMLGKKDEEISNLKSQLEAAPKAEALKSAQDLAATEKARADKAESDLKAEIEAIPGKINAEVARIVASNGFTGTVETVSSNKDDGKPDLSALTGIAKVKAAFAAKAAAQKVS